MMNGTVKNDEWKNESPDQFNDYNNIPNKLKGKGPTRLKKNIQSGLKIDIGIPLFTIMQTQ